MKLAFTTLGCPTWDLDRIIAAAVENGYDGVDFRGYKGEMNIYKLPEFQAGAKDTAKRIKDAGLEVPCLSSSAQMFLKPREAVEEIRAYAPLCRTFGSSFIRVFGGDFKAIPRVEAIRTATDTFRRVLPVIRDYGIKLVMETHDAWLDCKLMKGLMDSVDSPDVGVLWDVHHPYRMLNESPEKTVSTFGALIWYTHVKDSIPKENPEKPKDYRLCLPGEGDIPLRSILDSLKRIGYSGYLTFEWEKKWHPDIEEPEVAFPRYASFMKRLLGN